MPLRAKLSKHTSTSATTKMEDAQIHGWERLKLTNQDKKVLKKLGLVQKASLIFPGDESSPKPSMNYRTEIAGSHQSAASSDKVTESDASDSVHSPPHAVSPKNKRKRIETEDSGASKPAEHAVEETSPEDEGAFDPYGDAGSVSSGEKAEEEELAVIGAAPTSTSNTAILFEEHLAAADSSPPPQQIINTSTPPPSPRAPSSKRQKVGAGDEQMLILGSSSTSLVNDFIRLGSQSIGFRDEANALKASLQQAKERTEALEAKLKLTKEALEKAQTDAASVEELRQRLHKAETSLSDNLTEQIAREKGLVDRIEAQSRRFFRRNEERFELLEPKNDRLLDALSILELQGDLARTNLDESRAAFSRLFPHFFPKETRPEMFSALIKRFIPNEDLALAYQRENLKIGIEGTIALVANNGQKVDSAKVGERW
ncbi:hypothetical protein QYE76_066882 [Lolium multiflorum]|uniref:Uncharacterized protein n=1 Tax=Lolium multiflorum TaxID=4521 RepID=A0AAD8SDK6_LOLMU|nr:hypothetical protein QYE76_066882 [Lolium multiflorum]